ncbi:MAG TPA: hypothetical protein VJG32_17290 [Anaerolineae bacterium]|nr:hypothetical protein [Anaerolineae bacterium]
MWATLSTRQRRILIGLGVANVVLLLAVGTLALAPAPEPVSTAPSALPDTSAACRSTAAGALSAHAVAGTVAIHADGGIDFSLSGADPADAWDALAVSAELPELGCGPYDPIRIDVPDPSLTPRLRLVVEARWSDVQAWSLGRLDDTAFSERTHRSTYLQPDSTARP